MKDSDLMRQARVEIIQRGWASSELIESDGSVCALGALGCAAGFEDIMNRVGYSLFIDSDAVLHGAAETLAAAMGYDPGDADGDCVDAIYCFNDAAADVNVVLEAFDRAEKIAEQREAAR